MAIRELVHWNRGRRSVPVRRVLGDPWSGMHTDIDHLFGRFGGGPHREAIIIADDRHQPVAVETGFDIHIDAPVLEDLFGPGAHFIRNQYFGPRHALTSWNNP